MDRERCMGILCITYSDWWGLVGGPTNDGSLPLSDVSLFLRPDEGFQSKVGLRSSGLTVRRKVFRFGSGPASISLLTLLR